MIPPINRLPPGLLDLLGIRSGGRNPQVLLEQLQPHFDLTSWYLEASTIRTIATTTIGAGSAGVISFATSSPVNIPNLECPANEIWMAQPGCNIQWSFPVSAGHETRVVLMSRNIVSGVQMRWPMTLAGWDTSDAAFIREGEAVLQSQMWIPPGHRIQGVQFGTRAPAAVISITANLSLVRMRI